MAKLSENGKQTLRKIKEAYNIGDTELIEKIETLVGTPVEFSGELLTAYEALGDNPLDVPELDLDKDKYEDESEFMFALADKVLKYTGINDDNHTISEITSFVLKCYKKVTSFHDDKGFVKTTPNTIEAKMPKFSDMKELKKLETDRVESMKEIGDFDPETDDIKEYIKQIEDIDKAYDKKVMPRVYKITQIKGNALTDWEKALLKTSVIEHISNGLKSATGRLL